MGLLSVETRVAMGLALAAAVAPAIGPAVFAPHEPWPVLVLAELVRGVPVAISAATSLFAAMVAGGVADTALGNRPGDSGIFDRRSGPLAVLFGLFSAALFLELGGADRVAARLALVAESGRAPLSHAIVDLATGLDVGASVGAPVLVVALAFDVGRSIVARDLGAAVAGFFAPLRTLAVLVALAVLFETMADAIAGLERAL
jgi:type III secretory pathway component EscT